MKTLDFNFLDQCRKITEDYEKIKGRWTPEAQILHIIKEVCEFDIELRKPYSDSNQLEEYADIGLTWLAAGNYFGYSNQSIHESLISKLSIVKQRVKKEIDESKESKKEFWPW